MLYNIIKYLLLIMLIDHIYTYIKSNYTEVIYIDENNIKIKNEV